MAKDFTPLLGKSVSAHEDHALSACPGGGRTVTGTFVLGKGGRPHVVTTDGELVEVFPWSIEENYDYGR